MEVKIKPLPFSLLVWLNNLQKVKKNFSFKKGVSLVEVVIAASIISIATVTLFASFGLIQSFALRNTNSIKAALLLEQGAEELRLMRDASWTTYISPISSGTTYRFATSTATWTATTTVLLIDNKFDRSFVLSDVYRDSNYSVVSSGGTLDTGSKKITISVAWREGNATTTKTLETYLFNVFSN